MTETAARPATGARTGTPAANQAGAHINKDAYNEAKDFLPLNGIDHVEFWVGNARQAAHYFRALWGFTPVAFAAWRPGSAIEQLCHAQNDITIVLTGALSPDGEIAEHVPRHGDGVQDIAFAVDDVDVVVARDDDAAARARRWRRRARRR